MKYQEQYGQGSEGKGVVSTHSRNISRMWTFPLTKMSSWGLVPLNEDDGLGYKAASVRRDGRGITAVGFKVTGMDILGIPVFAIDFFTPFT
jgi:hypothetical protein